jgi:hypothetical protein
MFKKITQNKTGFILSITVLLFLAVTVATRLYKIEDLPLQTVGALLGSVVTALITYYLLIGQSKSEEEKEKNVSVFQTKSEKYEIFINYIWEIWNDRTITTLEFTELIKSFSKNVLLYAKEETISSILDNLDFISTKITEKEIDNSHEILKEIFKIINKLAEDLGVNPTPITEDTIDKLNKIESEMIPVVEEMKRKDSQEVFKNNYFNGVKEYLTRIQKSDYILNDIKFDILNNRLSFRINSTRLSFNISKNSTNDNWSYKIKVPKDQRKFNSYRIALPGSGKALDKQETIANSGGNFTLNIHFNDIEKINSYINSYTDEQYINSNELGKQIIDSLNSMRIKGKTLKEMIIDCEA